MAYQEAGQQQNIRPKVLDEDLRLGYTCRTAGNRVAWEGEPGAEGYLHLLVCYLKLISDWKQATRIICNTSRDAETASPWGSVKNWCHSEFIITWPTMKLTVPMTPPDIEYWMTFIWADFLLIPSEFLRTSLSDESQSDNLVRILMGSLYAVWDTGAVELGQISKQNLCSKSIYTAYCAAKNSVIGAAGNMHLDWSRLRLDVRSFPCMSLFASSQCDVALPHFLDSVYYRESWRGCLKPLKHLRSVFQMKARRLRNHIPL